jgi:DNA-binding phage protein
MALTREFKDTVMELCKDPEYRKALLIEALETYLEGDIPTGNALMRDYLNGCLAFTEVAQQIGVKEPSLRRMLAPKGNPQLKNFLQVFTACRVREGMSVESLVV